MGTKTANGTGWTATAFSTTSFMLGWYNAGLVDSKGLVSVLPVTFICGGLIQMLVAILETFLGNALETTVFGTNGPCWIIRGALYLSP